MAHRPNDGSLHFNVGHSLLLQLLEVCVLVTLSVGAEGTVSAALAYGRGGEGRQHSVQQDLQVTESMFLHVVGPSPSLWPKPVCCGWDTDLVNM